MWYFAFESATSKNNILFIMTSIHAPISDLEIINNRIPIIVLDTAVVMITDRVHDVSL